MNPQDNLLTLSIDRLPINTCIGVLELEKIIPQDFEVTLHFSFPYDGSDNLDATINYADVCAMITEQMRRGADLIEHVAHRILGELHSRWPQIREATVTVSKLSPPLPSSPAATSASLRQIFS